MAILRATRHPMNFIRIGGTVLAGSGGYGAGTIWDPAYVKMLLQCDSGGVSWRDPFRDLSGAVLPLTDHWYQIEGQLANGGASANGNVRFLFLDSAGVGIIRQVGNTGGVPNKWQYWTGSAWVDFTFNSTPALSFGLYTWTFRFYRAASGGITEVYLNNALVAQHLGNTQYGASGPVLMDYANLTIGSGANGPERLSGSVITTANENPWGIKIKTHVVTADGALTGMVGPWSNVDEVDPDTADVIAATAAGQKRSLVIDDIPLPTGTDVVRGQFISVMARCGNTGPTGLQIGTLMSGAEQTQPTRTLTTGWRVYNEFVTTNTVTGNAPTPAEINAAELLLVAA